MDDAKLLPLQMFLGTGQLLLGKKQEDTVRVGHNAFLTLTAQTTQVFFGLQMAGRTGGSLAWASRTITYLAFVPVPLYVTVALHLTNPPREEYGQRPAAYRRALFFVQDHMTQLCHILAVMGGFNLWRQGQGAAGGMMVGMTALGYIDRGGYLPTSFSYFLEKGLLGAIINLNLTVGNFMETMQGLQLALLTGSDLLMWLYEEHLEPTFDESEWHNAVDDPYNPPAEVDIDWRHVVGYEALTIPKAPPEANIQTLIDLWNAIDWTDPTYEEMARREAKKDVRWRERVGTDPVGYIRKGLQKYVRLIRDRSITIGTPENYDRLENMSLWIAHESSQPGVNQRDIAWRLCTLGLSGVYCGGGLIRAAKEVYDDVGGGWVPEGLREQLYKASEAHRKRIFDTILGSLSRDTGDRVLNIEFKLLRLMINPSDQHWNAILQRIFGQKFGLSDAALARDDQIVSMMGRLQILMVSTLYGSLGYTWGLRQCYSPKHLLRWMATAIDQNLVKDDLIRTWYWERLGYQQMLDFSLQARELEERNPEQERDIARQVLISHGNENPTTEQCQALIQRCTNPEADPDEGPFYDEIDLMERFSNEVGQEKGRRTFNGYDEYLAPNQDFLRLLLIEQGLLQPIDPQPLQEGKVKRVLTNVWSHGPVGGIIQTIQDYTDSFPRDLIADRLLGE